jgi:hypothetical protein
MMEMTMAIRRVMLMCCCLMLTFGVAFGLADFTKMDEVIIGKGDAALTISVLPDVHDPSHWYYVPPYPRLYEYRSADGKTVKPAFTMVEMQYRDEKTGKIEVQGAMQFLVTVALPPDEKEELRQACAKMADLPLNKVTCSSIPINYADISIFNPLSGESLEVVKPAGAMMVPLTEADRLPVFVLIKNENTAEILREMMKERGGFPIYIQMVISGLGAPAGVRVTADYELAYKQIYKSRDLRLAIGVCSFVGDADWSDVNLMHEFERTGALKFEFLEGERLKQKTLLGIAKGIITRIHNEVYQSRTLVSRYMQVPRMRQVGGRSYAREMMMGMKRARQAYRKQQMDKQRLFGNKRRPGGSSTTDESTDKPKKNRKWLDGLKNFLSRRNAMMDGQPDDAYGGSRGGGKSWQEQCPPIQLKVEYTTQMADRSRVLRKKEVFDYRLRQVLDRKTGCGGFINLGAYSKAVRDACMVKVPYGTFERAYLPLPRVEEDSELNIKNIEMYISIIHRDDPKKKTDAQRVVWPSSEPGQEVGWYDWNRQKRDMVVYPLTGIKAALKVDDFSRLAFRVETTVMYQPAWARAPLSVTNVELRPVVSGGGAVLNPLKSFNVWVVDVEDMIFHADMSESPLRQASFKFTFDASYEKKRQIKTVMLDFPARRHPIDDADFSRQLLFLVPVCSDEVTVRPIFRPIRGYSLQSGLFPYTGKNLLEVEECRDGDFYLDNDMWMNENDEFFADMME